MAKDFKSSQNNRNAYAAIAPELAEMGSVPPQAVELEEAILGAMML